MGDPRTYDPFAPFSSLPAAKAVKTLLLSNEVQEIRFAFGSIPVWPAGFRAVADLVQVIPGTPGLTVYFDPVGFLAMWRAGKRVKAQYSAKEDRIYLPSYRHVEHPLGKGNIVHEAVHALCDLRGRSTALRSEEGAAELAQGWYYLASGQESDAPTQMAAEVLEIARAVRGRAATTSGMVNVRASEINAVRAVMARAYDNVHARDHDGIAGHRL